MDLDDHLLRDLSKADRFHSTLDRNEFVHLGEDYGDKHRSDCDPSQPKAALVVLEGISEHLIKHKKVRTSNK